MDPSAIFLRFARRPRRILSKQATTNDFSPKQVSYELFICSGSILGKAEFYSASSEAPSTLIDRTRRPEALSASCLAAKRLRRIAEPAGAERYLFPPSPYASATERIDRNGRRQQVAKSNQSRHRFHPRALPLFLTLSFTHARIALSNDVFGG